MAAPTAVAQPRPANDHFSLSSRPTCPSVLIPFEQQLYALPVQRLDVQAEFNVSTAFIKITGVWRNIANYKSDCLFVLPLNGTVTSVNIKINQRIFETIIIPKDEAEKMRRDEDKEKKEGKRKTEEKEKVAAAEGDDKKSGQLPPMSFEEYIPNLFRLPIPGVASTDYITVSVVYIEPLYFSNGQYHFTLPLTFGANLVPAKKTIGDILTLRCIINSVSPMTRWECKSHELKCTKSAYARVELEAINLNQRYEGDAKSKEKKASSNNAGGEPQSPSNQPGAPSQPQAATGSVDFSLAYTMTSETILPTLIVQPDDQVQGQPETGNFLLFVTPPSLENKDNFFTRNMVFLLDRSGSMNGEPFQEAIKALRAAVTALRPSDMFTVIAFDHRQEYFRKELVAATEQNVAACKAWTETFAPERGGTDIQAPLEWALQTLEKDSTSNLTLPFVVLLTDGCVGNERIICTKANEYCKKTRVLTFGIGSYCNWFFLKMLAQIGRGFSDVVVYKERIFAQMLQLLNMAAIPVITNVQLSIQGIKGVELYPFPIPDLFMGAPLTIAGRYAGKFPDEVKITGLQSDKSEYAMTIQPRSSEVIPVNKVFIKQRLDLLTARSWLEDSKPLQEQVVDISCTESMPSAYTTMVAYETTEEKRKEMKQERQGAPGENQPLLGGADGKDDSTASQNGGNSGDNATKKQIVLAQAQKKKWYRNPKILGAIAVGNAVLIGAAAFSFGDLAASMSNVPVIGALGDGIGSLASGDCCGDCGSCECDCDCDCGDCLAC